MENQRLNIFCDHKSPYSEYVWMRKVYDPKGHTINACYIRNYGICYIEYVRVRKVSNPKGHKENWVPRCN